jgi:hypothetical protein
VVSYGCCSSCLHSGAQVPALGQNQRVSSTNRLRDGSQVVRLTRRPRCIPRKILDTHFCSRLEGLGKLKKCSDLIDNRNRNLPACSTVPHLTTVTRARVVHTLRNVRIHVREIVNNEWYIATVMKREEPRGQTLKASESTIKSVR